MPAAANLRWLAACAPGLVMHGLFSIPLQARQRFVLPAWALTVQSATGAVPVYPWQLQRQRRTGNVLFAGSVLMCLPLLAPVWSFGWRPWQVSGDPLAGRELLGRIGPLLASNVASQGLALLGA